MRSKRVKDLFANIFKNFFLRINLKNNSQLFQEQNFIWELTHEKQISELILCKCIVHLCTIQKFPKYFPYFQLFLRILHRKNK